MSIFTIEKRNEVQETMLQVGIDLIREKGIRKMTISDITSRTGIGKGTFYHFYPSKEFYAYDVILYSKNRMKQRMNEIEETYGGLNRTALSDILREFSFGSSNNLVSSISAEDMNWMLGELPEDYTLNMSKEENIMTSIFSRCVGKRENIPYTVIANFMKIMSVTIENKERFYQDALEENLRLIREQILDLIFEDGR